MYSDITRYISDAFRYDFNLIVEDFPFYQQLTPKMKTELIRTTFSDFKKKFSHFFDPCQQGFTNEFIINMYTRIFANNTQIVAPGRKFREMYFITKGHVVIYNTLNQGPFIKLPQYSYFGDYQILFDLNTNILFKTKL